MNHAYELEILNKKFTNIDTNVRENKANLQERATIK